MSDLQSGDKAPDFTLPRDGGGEISLSDFRGENVILYFYPKDNTPGCTKESCAFRDNLSALKKLGTKVIGISKDSVKSHDKFKEKYDLNFPLASDEESEICESYGVWKEKNMYGRKYMGIERTTFLIDAKGVIQKIWRRVRVKGHVDDVMKTVQELEKAA